MLQQIIDNATDGAQHSKKPKLSQEGTEEVQLSIKSAQHLLWPYRGAYYMCMYKVTKLHKERFKLPKEIYGKF